MKKLISFLVLFACAAPAQTFSPAAVGHEFRQDDLPEVATCPDGSAWIAWLSFAGDRDDVVIRQFKDGKWGSLQWVPSTSGDSWLPQIGCDARNRVSVVWSQQITNNWDLYARVFDPARQEWGPLDRLSNHPMPDINPRLASDKKGHFALVWQSFRGGHSNIFLKTFDGERWSNEIRVTSTQANDWEPAAAFDAQGNIWIAYDTYRNGNYDIYASKVEGGRIAGPEMAVAASPLFESRATIAVDTANRVWVAWEEGAAGWGKDQGYTIRDAPMGAPLGALRRPRIRCLANGTWKTTQPALDAAFGPGNTYQPHVFSDGKGSVWVAAKSRRTGGAGAGPPNRGFWEYSLTRFEGNRWSPAKTIPNSKGRSSTRIGAGTLADGTLILAWSTDNRVEAFYHRPLRQQIYASVVSAPGAVSSTEVEAQLVAPSAPTPGPVRAAHPNEAQDLQAIRAYRAKVDGKALGIVRGDFHRHTELSWDSGGAGDGNLQDFYRYMIDVASMDFGASTDHQGGAWPYWWWYSQKMTDMYHVPGVYSPIFGYERSAIYPNGHRNVFFAKRSDSRVTPFHLKAGAQGFGLPQAPIGDEPGIGTAELVENDTKLLYEEIGPRKGIAIPHTTGTRMGTDWRDNNPDLEPVVEIFQGARTNYEKVDAPLAADPAKDGPHVANAGYEPTGMVSNAWAKGYKLGIITSSDHGSTHMSYAMVYTADASRQGILDAIRQRHTYGAMDNIIMDVRMGKHFMGDEFPLKKVEPMKVIIRGTVELTQVDIIKDSKVIYSTTPNQRNAEFEFTDRGDIAGRHYYYVRVAQKNRMYAWSSPMFVNYR